MIIVSLIITIIGITFFGTALVILIAAATLAVEEAARKLRLEIKDWADYYDYLESKKK